MPRDASALAVNLGKRFGRRSGFSAESPLLSDSSMFIRLFILFALPCLKNRLYGSAKADTVLVGPISLLVLLDSLMVSGHEKACGITLDRNLKNKWHT